MKRYWVVISLFVIPTGAVILSAALPKSLILELSLLVAAVILMLISLHYAKETV